MLSAILLDSSNPFWDVHIIDLVNKLEVAAAGMSLITVAKEIAAAFSLIYIAVRAYAMIAGDGRLEVIPLFRPFLINLVILNMGTFMTILKAPGNQAENLMQTSFNLNAATINDLMDQKSALNETLVGRLYAVADSSSMTTHAMHEGDVFASVENAVYDAGISLELTARLVMLKAQLMLIQLITNVIMGVFKGVGYCLFFISVIILTILGILGPLAMAFSIGGAFKDSWIHWASKVIAVSFYKPIGYIILNISCAILNYGFQQEIDRLNNIVSTGDQAEFISKVLHIDNYLGYLFIALIVAIAGVASTPLISTWFISTSGAGAFAQSMAGAPGRMAAVVSRGGKAIS